MIYRVSEIKLEFRGDSIVFSKTFYFDTQGFPLNLNLISDMEDTASFFKCLILVNIFEAKSSSHFRETSIFDLIIELINDKRFCFIKNVPKSSGIEVFKGKRIIIN